MRIVGLPAFTRQVDAREAERDRGAALHLGRALRVGDVSDDHGSRRQRLDAVDS